MQRRHREQVAAGGQDLKCASFEAAARRIAGRALKSHSCRIRTNNAPRTRYAQRRIKTSRNADLVVSFAHSEGFPA